MSLDEPTASTGPYRIIRPSFDRRVAMDAFAALPPNHPMVALIELDVTEALRLVESRRHEGARLSLFSFLVQRIAVAISEHPDLNLVRHGKQLVRFEDVDVSVPVEVRTPDGHIPREVVLRRAHARSPEELYAEIEAAREKHASAGELGAEDRGFRAKMTLMRWLPRFVRLWLMRLYMRSAFRIKESAGTTIVTSVARFSAMPGFGFTFTTGPRAAAFVIGSVSERPWVQHGSVVVRSVLGLSIIVDHDLVDGAPAARFALRLKELVESP